MGRCASAANLCGVAESWQRDLRGVGCCGCSAKLLRQPFAPPRAKAKGSAEKARRAGAVEEAARRQAPATGLFENFKCRPKQKA